MFTPSNGDRGSVRNFIVVLTDGRSDNRDATWREAQLAREAGIHIITGTDHFTVVARRRPKFWMTIRVLDQEVDTSRTLKNQNNVVCQHIVPVSV